MLSARNATTLKTFIVTARILTIIRNSNAVPVATGLPPDRPGAYKRYDYVTGKEEIGAALEDVAEEISALLSEVQDIPDEKILTAAACFHATFENIHPFADGNGRTGRLAMNYLLVLHNHPPIVIHEEDRKAYYEALEAWDTAQQLDPLRSFLHEQTAKTWEKQIARAEKQKKDFER